MFLEGYLLGRWLLISSTRYSHALCMHLFFWLILDSYYLLYLWTYPALVNYWTYVDHLGTKRTVYCPIFSQDRPNPLMNSFGWPALLPSELGSNSTSLTHFGANSCKPKYCPNWVRLGYDRIGQSRLKSTLYNCLVMSSFDLSVHTEL